MTKMKNINQKVVKDFGDEWSEFTHVELNNSTSQSERTTSRRFTTYDNQTSIPRIRTIPRTTFSRTSRAIQPNPDTNISDQEFTSYVNLATQLLNNFSQGDISGSVDILYSIQ